MKHEKMQRYRGFFIVPYILAIIRECCTAHKIFRLTFAVIERNKEAQPNQGVTQMRGNVNHEHRRPIDHNTSFEFNGKTYYKEDLLGVRVCYSERRRKSFRATIMHNGKRHHLGYYATPEDAVNAYQDAREKVLSGEWDS